MNFWISGLESSVDLYLLMHVHKHRCMTKVIDHSNMTELLHKIDQQILS